MDLVKEAVREVASRLPAQHRGTALALEEDALDAVRFIVHCSVRRVYATVERTYAKDGVVSPLVLVKSELHFKGIGGPTRRTVVVGLSPYLVQVLTSMKWPSGWAAWLEAELRDPLAKRAEELEAEIAKGVEALKGDREAVATIQGKAKEMIEKERERRRTELRDMMVVLMRHGWTEEDVLSTWREATCKDVHET